MVVPGIEPGRFRLTGGCSAYLSYTGLVAGAGFEPAFIQIMSLGWYRTPVTPQCRRRESNPRRSLLERQAAPGHQSNADVVVLAGFEPASPP